MTDQKREEATDAGRLIVWWAAITLLGWVVLVLMGHPAIDSLFEWTSALNNVGLSSGVSSAEEVPAVTRIALILAMWLGRVEILAAILVVRVALHRNL